MNENSEEILIDLLIRQATEGLTDIEQQQLDKLEAGSHDNSFAMTTAAISLIDERGEEPMPVHLRANIRASAEGYFDEKEAGAAPIISVRAIESKRSSIFTWLGWVVAVAACLALVANIYFTRLSASAGPTLAQQRRTLIETTPDITKASFTKGTVQEISDVSGDIVWSDSKQAGFMILRGLPVNDRSRTTYQLWIFDQNQEKETPVSGGVFDIDQNGEVIIPIKATLRITKPNLFAVTIEKPGGVMKSDKKNIAALGKLET